MKINLRPYAYDKTKWQCDLIGNYADGVPFRKRPVAPYTNKLEAKKWATAEFVKLSGMNSPKAESPAPSAVTYTFDLLWEDRELSQKNAITPNKNSTEIGYGHLWRNHLKEMIGTMDVTNFDQQSYQELVRELKVRKRLRKDRKDPTNQYLKPKTINEIQNVLWVMLSLAIDLGKISKMPIKLERLAVEETIMEFYSFEAFDHLRDTAEKMGPHEYALVVLLGEAGLRSGEFQALRPQDVTMSAQSLVIAKRFYRGVLAPPKGGVSKPVAMSPNVHKALSQVRFGDDFCFVTDNRYTKKDSVPYTHAQLVDMMQRIQKRAGMNPTGGLHILRHTFCSHLAMRGVDVITIKELARHSKLETTMNYMRLSPDHKQRAVATLSERPTHLRLVA